MSQLSTATPPPPTAIVQSLFGGTIVVVDWRRLVGKDGGWETRMQGRELGVRRFAMSEPKLVLIHKLFKGS